MNNPKAAFANAIGIAVVYLLAGSTLALIPAVFALVFGIKAVKQKKISQSDKAAAIIGIAAGAGYLIYGAVGFALYYLVL